MAGQEWWAYLGGQGSWDSTFLFKVHKVIRNNPHSIRAKEAGLSG